MILNYSDKPNPEAAIPTLIQPSPVAAAQAAPVVLPVTMPEDRSAAFRTSVANRLCDVTVQTSAENPTALIQAQAAVTAQIAAEQRALIAALSDHDFVHAMASAYIAEMAVQEPNPDYAISMTEAHCEVESILKNRIEDCKEFIALLNQQDFIAAARAEVAQPAKPNTEYQLPQRKIDEYVRRLVQPADVDGPEPAVHVAASARGQQMTHQALANLFGPEKGVLRAPLVHALAKAWPQTTGEQLEHLAQTWLKARHDPAHSSAKALKPDGAVYQEAMRRAEELQAKKLGVPNATSIPATQTTAPRLQQGKVEAPPLVMEV